MAEQPKGLFKAGGVSLVLSGVMFLVKLGLDLAAGSPPSNGTEILAWVASSKLALALVSEVLFIGGMLLIPGMIAVHASLASKGGHRAALGTGVIAVTLPVLFAVLIVHGRLVYDVYGLRVRDPAVAELVVALYGGGIHAVGLMMAIGTLVLSLTMRPTYGRAIVWLGVVTAALDAVGSYPWALGTALLVLCHVAFAGWFIAVGWRLWSLGAATAPRPA